MIRTNNVLGNDFFFREFFSDIPCDIIATYQIKLYFNAYCTDSTYVKIIALFKFFYEMIFYDIAFNYVSIDTPIFP